VCPLGIFWDTVVYFHHFGMLYQDTSGNPGSHSFQGVFECKTWSSGRSTIPMSVQCCKHHRSVSSSLTRVQGFFGMHLGMW
jgi:hypothetical protein